MPCLHPISIVNPHYKKFPDLLDTDCGLPLDYWLQVPCGKCCECRKNRGKSWRIRLYNELFYQKPNRNNLFVTFTFSDKSMKKYKDNPQLAVRRFCELYRKYFKKSPRHFFITELGSHTGRLHLHGILFDVCPGRSFKAACKVIRRFWRKNGWSWIGYVNYSTCNYILKYLTKIDSEHPDYTPTLLVSPGLGKGFVEDEKNKAYYWNNVARMRVYMHNSYPSPFPRYYKVKLSTPEARFESWLTSALDPPPFCKEFRGRKYFDEISYKRALNFVYEESLNNRTSTYVRQCGNPLTEKELSLIYKSCYYDYDYARYWDRVYFKYNR